MRKSNSRLDNEKGRERGQILVLVAAAAIAIIAIIGLVMDVGLIFIANARLRRAVDAAALSAALQYREYYTTENLIKAANEFLVLNGFDNPSSQVSDCDNTPGDTTLCTTPARKLVRVTSTVQVPLAFLPVIGIYSVPISATATSETASLDVILVIDRSESMTYGKDLSHKLDQDDPMRDPFYCNGIPKTDIYGVTHVSSCEPFFSVTTAAIDFAKTLFFPYDHVAVVTFDKDAGKKDAYGNRVANLSLVNGDYPNTVIDTLRQLTVYQGDESVDSNQAIFPNGSPSRCYGQVTSCSPVPICPGPPTWSPKSNYQALLGRGQDPCLPGFVNPPDPSNYTTTNIGAGLQLAGNEFTTDSRQQSLWVVILLTDGVANAGHSSAATPFYYCPHDTWGNLPRCSDGNPDPTTRHSGGSAEYDDMDYAQDMADFVGKAYPVGQNALIYTIGLGPEVDSYPSSYIDPYNMDLIDYPSSTGEGLGRIFLNYAAHVGNGQAFYAAQPSDLQEIFREIGSNIATRISH